MVWAVTLLRDVANRLETAPPTAAADALTPLAATLAALERDADRMLTREQ